MTSLSPAEMAAELMRAVDRDDPSTIVALAEAGFDLNTRLSNFGIDYAVCCFRVPLCCVNVFKLRAFCVCSTTVLSAVPHNHTDSQATIMPFTGPQRHD